MENVHFSLQLIDIRCTFINTASCDEQHSLYRIVLTYVYFPPQRLVLLIQGASLCQIRDVAENILLFQRTLSH